MFTNTYDPTLSEKFFNFKDFSELKSINFNDRITQFYNSAPIYFSPVSATEIDAQLRAFTESSQFEIFISQLDNCFFKIDAFINTHHIQVTTTLSALTNDPSGQTQIEVNANRLLDRFLQRLKSNFYANSRANLYADGKRYLEMLSILIEEPEINLDDRITQLKALIDDDALEKCADGVYSRLQETVENLEAIINIDVYKWIKNFLKNQLTESVQKSISSLTDTTLTEKIADIVGRSRANFEIHYHNWMVEMLRNELGFSFLKQSKDSYVDRINQELGEPENNYKKTKVFDIVEQGKKKLIQSITATHLVEFISHGIYQAVKEQEVSLESSVRYSELVNLIDVKLAVLGADDTFSLGEIFDTNGELKPESSFYKTITLRLLNKEFFRQPVLFSTDHYQLIFFKRNLQLGLMSVPNSGEVFRIVDFIQQPDGLKHLLGNVAVEQRSTLLNHLIQSTEDFIIFLNSADPGFLPSISSLLSGSLTALGLSRAVIQDTINQHQPEFLSKFEAIFTILENLDGMLNAPETAKHLFYEDMINPAFFESMLKEYLNLRLRLVADNYSVLDVGTLLDKLFAMEIQELNGITFYAPQWAHVDRQKAAQTTYLKELGFEQIRLQGITFEVAVDDCYFTDISIQKSYFHEKVSKIDFINAKLDHVHFKTLHSSNLIAGKFTDIKLNEMMENCDAREALFEKAFLTRTHQVSFRLASLLDTQFGEVSECSFSSAQLMNVDIKYARECNFLGAILNNVAFGEILDNVSSRSIHFSFKNSELKRVSFTSIDLYRDKIDFSYARVDDSIFRSLDLRQAIFKGTRFENVLFDEINFNNVIFEKIIFGSNVIFDKCNLIQATFKNSDLSKLDIKENNLLVGAKLEKVKLTPYQLINCYFSNILDYSTVTLVDDPAKTPSEIETFLSQCQLDRALLSPQAVRYLSDKSFCFRGVDLRHIDFEATGLTFIDLKGATISFTQALQLYVQGRENFSKTNIIVNFDSAAADKRIQALKAVMQRDRPGIDFIFYLLETASHALENQGVINEAVIAHAKNGLSHQAVNTNEALEAILKLQQQLSEQDYAYKELVKIIFSHFDAEQQQIGLERLTEHALYRANQLGEMMAGQKLLDMRSTVIARFSEEVISEHINFFKSKFFQTSSNSQTEVFISLLNELSAAKVVHCLAHVRKKRSLECAGSEELMAVDEAQAATQAKEIMLLVAAERRLLWQKNLRPLLDELNRGGEQWFPLLETAKDLGNEGETIELINVRTQEKQIHQLSGKYSLEFLASLRELHNVIPQEKFRENLKSLTEDLTINEPREAYKYHENNFSGDFLLAIGLTTNTIIHLINNKGCRDSHSSSANPDLGYAECAVNIAGMSAMYLTVTLQLAELIEKDSLTQESLLLKGLSVTSKVFGGINVLFLLAQDGFDIVKLVQAKSEGERMGAITQLVIDGTLTAQTFVSMVAEGLIASVSGALIVPFMGLGVGLPSLVNNYETLLLKALQTGRVFNELHEQHKKNGYELITQIQLKDDKGKEQTVLLNETQRFMKPVDTVVITKIDFVNKELDLKGPWIYSSTNKGNCVYVNHHKEDAFDFRKGVGLANTIALSEAQLASKTWLLPLANFYINYEYQQEPTIIFRHDAELTTLRELQRNEKFISDEYCFPTSYGIYKYAIEYVPTTIKIVVDERARNFIIPALEGKLHDLLTYEMDTRGLERGQGIIYLNPGVSIHLYLTPYSWVLNGQNLSKDTIEFTQQGLKIGDVEIKQLFPQASTASNQAQPLIYVNKQGHVFKLDLEQKQMMLMTVNYSALQKSQQTLDEFLMHQQPNSPVVRVINYHNPDDGYEGTATYVVSKKSLFYTLNSAEQANDAALISLQKEAAFFYDANNSLLWCTETHTHRLLHYYVFPAEINSVSQQGDNLLINVANQFYYKINTVTKESLLIAVQSPELFTLFLKLQAFSSFFVDVSGTVIKLDVTQDRDWQTLAQALQTLIRSTLVKARQAGSLYQKMSSEMRWPNLNDSSISLQVAANEPPFIWLRKEQEHYQLISMQQHELDESDLENNEYRKAHINSGQYLGCFFDSQQPDLRRLIYLVKEHSTDPTGKIYFQTVNAHQTLVSFKNTPPRLLVDLLVKQAVWNENKLVVLTEDNTYQQIEASAQTSVIGLTADWVQKNPNWWQAIAVYLEKHSSKQMLISVQGINDQQGNEVIVYYDHQAKQFLIINQAHFDAVYCGKIAQSYFFTKDNCAYQVPGMTLEQIEALFEGPQAKQSLPALAKIADYYPMIPLGIPTENDQLLMQKLPKFSLSLQEFRVLLPHGAELVFDPKDGTWRVLAIKAGWFNQQENLPEAVSEWFAHMAKTFTLTANQLHTPIPIESTDFCLVENHRFVEIPGVQWPNEQFNYLGQTDQAGYYFYDAANKAIILLSSSDRADFEKSDRNSTKPGLAVEYAAKLNQESLLLEIDPLQIPMQAIPLFKGYDQLVLKMLAANGNHLMSLPESLMEHYSMIIYQAEGANPIELPGYSWFASKNQHSLMLSNGHSQLVIPYADDKTLPNITIQVNYVHANQTQVLKENTRFIDQRINRQQTLKSIPILGYGLKWIEALHVLPDAAAGHYQKDNLAVESVAVKLTGQRIPEKPGSASFLSRAAAATLSAITSFALSTTLGLGYVFVRRYRRPAHAAGIQNTLAAVSIPLMSYVPLSEAQTLSNEHNPLVDATDKKSGERMTSEDSQNGFYESEMLEQGFASLTQSCSSVAGILAMEFKKRRERRFTQLDVPRKIRLKQIELSQAQHTLQTLVNAFIADIEATLKKTTHLDSTASIDLIVRHLMNDYREYLNDSVSASRLTKQVDKWFTSFIASQPQQFVHDQKLLLARSLGSSSFSGLLNHLFIDKVCQFYREMIFSENQQLAEQQKCAVLTIIPTLVQSEEALVTSFSIHHGTDFSALVENCGDNERLELVSRSKQSLKQQYLADVKCLSNYFKPVNSSDIEQTLNAKKAMLQCLK